LVLVLRPRRDDSVVSEDAPRVCDGEFPADRAAVAFGTLPPGGDLRFQRVQVTDAAGANALARDETRLHLSGVEPTRVLGRVVDDESPPKAPANADAERQDDALLGVGTEVVEDEVDPPGIAVPAGDSPQSSRERPPVPIRRRVGESAACDWLDDAEDVGRAFPHVLVVGAGRLARLDGQSAAGRIEQLDGTLVQAHDRFSLAVRAGVQRQHVLHPVDELLVDFGHAPHFFPARASSRAWRGPS